MPRSRRAAAVAEPTAAIFRPLKARVSSPFCSSSSKKIRTPAGLVRASHWNSDRRDKASRKAVLSGMGTVSMEGISVTSAPKAVSFPVRADADSWGLVTSTRTPPNGRFSAQANCSE